VQTIRSVSKDRPDFYLTLGDDFSIEQLINRQTLSQEQLVIVRIGPTAGLWASIGQHPRKWGCMLVKKGQHLTATSHLLLQRLEPLLESLYSVAQPHAASPGRRDENTPR
jgi:hypothetical protein